MSEFTKPAEELSEEAVEYIELRLKKSKLKAAKDLSTVFGRFSGMLVMLIVGMTALTAASFGCILILGEAIDSYAAGSFIVAGALALSAAVLFVFRKKLFRNTFIRLFIKIFFDND